MNCPFCNAKNAEVLTDPINGELVPVTFANFCKRCGRDLRPYHGELIKYNNSRINPAGSFMRYTTIYKGRYFQTIMPLALIAYGALRGGLENYIILPGFYIAGLIFVLTSVIRFRVITRDDVLEVRNLFNSSRVRWADIQKVRKISKKNTRFNKTYEFITANDSTRINFNKFSPVCFHDVLNRIPAHCMEAITSDDQDELLLDEHALLLKWLKPKSLLITLLYLLAIGFFMDLLSGFEFFTYAKTISRWITGYITISILCLVGLTALFWIFSKDKLTDPLNKRAFHLLQLVAVGGLIFWLINRLVKLIGQ